MAHYVIFTDFCLKSRDIKTWRRTSERRYLTEAELYKERFASNPKSLSLPVQKLWPLSDFHKSGDLDLALRPIVKKKSSALSRVQKTSSAKEIGTIGQAVRPVEPLKTDKQTNRHTDRPRWPIYFTKSFSQSNKRRDNRVFKLLYRF